MTWAGWLLPYDTDLYFIVDEPAESQLRELVRQLALIGLDRVAGVFGAEAVGAPASTRAAVAGVPQMTVDELASRRQAHDVVDPRRAERVGVAGGPLPSARCTSRSGYLTDRLDEMPSRSPVVVHCQAGARSAIAASCSIARAAAASATSSADSRRGPRPGCRFSRRDAS